MLLKLDKVLFSMAFLFLIDVVLSVAPTPLIQSPQNSTYVTRSIEWNFTAYDDDNSSFSVKGYEDDVFYYDAPIFPNNTQESIDLSKSPGVHNVTVWADDAGETATAETIYTVVDYTLDDNYDNFVVETGEYDFELVAEYNPSIISDITTYLYWNNTLYNTTNQVSNSTHIINEKSLTIPLVVQNNTEINFHFINEITYVNTSVMEENTTSRTQNITQAYWISSFSSDSSNYLEGEDADLELVAGAIYSTANVSVNFTMVYNGSYSATYQVLSYSQAGNLRTYERTFSTGNSENTTETRVITGNLTIQYEDWVRSESIEDSIDVYKMQITNCSGAINTTTFRVDFYDEKTFEATNASIDLILFTIQNNDEIEQYSFIESTENTSYSYCLYPTWATLNTTVYIEYKSDASQKRPYYVLGAELTDDVSVVSAYILNDSYADYTNMYFYDENSDKLDNYYIRILKFNPSTTSWETMFIGRTDTSGILATYLEPMVQPYVFYVTDDSGDIIFRSESEVIPCLSGSCPPYEKHVYVEGTTSNYVDLGNIEYDYDFDESTRTLEIDVSDSSGISTGIWITVDAVTDFNITSGYINTSTTSSSLYFSQVLPNTSSQYIVNVYTQQYGSYYPIITRTITMQTVMRLGIMGVILSFLLIVGLVIGGYYIGNLVGGLIGGGAGLAISGGFGLIPIPVVGLYSILFVIAIIVIEVLRGD